MDINGYTSTYVVLENKQLIKRLKSKLRDEIKFREWYQEYINKNVNTILAVTDEIDKKYLLDTDFLVARTIDRRIEKLESEISKIGLEIVKSRQKTYDKIYLNSHSTFGYSKQYTEKLVKILKQNQKRINIVEINFRYGVFK